MASIRTLLQVLQFCVSVACLQDSQGMKSFTLSLMTGSHRYLVKLRGTFPVAQTMTLTRVTIYQRTLHVPGPGTCTSPMMSSMTTS